MKLTSAVFALKHLISLTAHAKLGLEICMSFTEKCITLTCLFTLDL